MIHSNPHPLAGQYVKLSDKAEDPVQGTVVEGALFRIEDWWDRVAGMSWMDANGNPAALAYAMRTGFGGHVPLSNEVVYGKIGSFGHLVHVSELEEPNGSRP